MKCFSLRMDRNYLFIIGRKANSVCFLPPCPVEHEVGALEGKVSRVGVGDRSKGCIRVRVCEYVCVCVV